MRIHFQLAALVLVSPFVLWKSRWAAAEFVTKIHAHLFCGVYVVLEVFQERESKEMLAASYLILQACIFEAFQTKVAHICLCLVRIKCCCSDQGFKFATIMGHIPVTSTTNMFPKYCDTNGRRIAIQMRGVPQYRWEGYWQYFPFPQSSAPIQNGHVRKNFQYVSGSALLQMWHF